MDLSSLLPKKVKRFLFDEKEVTKQNDEIELAVLSANQTSSQTSEAVGFNEYESVDNLINYFNTPDVKNLLSNTDKVLVFKLKVLHNFYGFNQTELNDLEKKCLKNSLIILIVSQENDKFYLCWKSKQIKHFLIFKIYSGYDFMNDIKIFEFLTIYLTHSLRKGHLGLHSQVQVGANANSFELHLLADHRNYNLLLVAAEMGNAHFAKFMLAGGFSTESRNTNAQTLAWNGQHFEVLLMLLQNNLTYPLTININECPGDIRDFHNISKNLNDAMLVKDKTKILQILTENPNMLYFYNDSNQSALAFALKNKLLDIYRLLISKDVRFGPHEDFNDFKKELRDSELFELKEIHFAESRFLPDNHLRILLSNSRLGHDTVNIKEKFHTIQKAFKTLNGNLCIQIILMIVAASRNFRIVFDFNQDSVEVIDPTADSSIKGMFYITGRIYIGAKELLDPENEHVVFGTLAHELCHYAMNLVYKNLANPYLRDDVNMRKKFDGILNHCKVNSVKEQIIYLVFHSYTSSVQHAELIVRVPHLIMHYVKEPERLKEVRHTFCKLFNDYEKRIVPQMKKTLPKIVEKAEIEFESKDRRIRLLSVISIILFFMCCIAIATAVCYMVLFYEKSDKISDDQKVQIFNANVTYMEETVQLYVLVGNNSYIFDKISSDHVSKMLNGKEIDFNELKLDAFVFLSWGNLTRALKDKFLNSNFTFQTENMTFKNVIESNSTIYDYLVSKQIIDVLNNTNIIIGQASSVGYDMLLPSVNETFSIFIASSENDLQWDKNKTVQENYDHYVSFNNDYKTISPSYRMQEVILKIRNSKFVIVSSEIDFDSIKLMNSKELAVKFKKMYPDKWVALLNLKEIDHEINNLEDFKYLLENIFELSSDNKFERKIFEEFFELGHLILFWDGFDEIFDKNNILKILNIIKEHSKNTQILLIKNTNNRAMAKVYTLVPFDEEEKVEFMRKCFISKNIEQSKIPLYMLKVQNITNVQESYGETLTPLLLGMVMELIANDVHINKSLNLFETYQILVSKKIEIWIKKSGFFESFKNKLILDYRSFDIVKLFQSYAIKTHLKMNYATLNLEVFRQSVPPELTFDELSRTGILYIKSINNFKFTHKPFGEFFVAQYIIENIYNNQDEPTENEIDFRMLTLYQSIFHPNIRKLIDSYLKTQNDMHAKPFSFKITQNIKTRFSKFLFMEQVDRNALPTLILFFQKDPEVIRTLLQLNSNETFYTAMFNYAYDLYMKYDPIDVQTLARSYLTDEEFQKFIRGKNQKGVILFSSYCINNDYLTSFNISHDYYKLDSNLMNDNDPLNVFKSITNELTNVELKELMKSQMIVKPIRSANGSESFIFDERLWDIVGRRLSVSDRNEIIQALFLYTTNEDVFILINSIMKYFLIQREAYNLFLDCEAWPFFMISNRSFNNTWKTFVSLTYRERQISMLESAMLCDLSYKPLKIFTPYNLLFYSLLKIQNEIIFSQILQTYESYFNETEMQNFILSQPNDFLLFATTDSNPRVFEVFLNYLRRCFVSNNEQLVKLIKRNVVSGMQNQYDILRSLDKNGNFQSLLRFWQKLINGRF